MRCSKHVVTLLLATFVASIGFAPIQSSALTTLEDDLKAFHDNPKEFLNRVPQKKTVATTQQIEDQNQESNQVQIFNQQEIKSRSFIKSKTKWRKSFLQENMSASESYDPSEPMPNDIADNLVDNQVTMRMLGEMDLAGLKSASLPFQPFSGDYWAMYKGILGARNYDGVFPQGQDWSLKFDYITQNPFMSVFSARNISAINTLSPSEKYDLLIGDTDGIFTQVQWKKGETYWRSSKNVESWMGICEGWAASSFNMPRPQQAVITTAFDGITPIKFNPAELKGLTAYQWSTTRYPFKFVGGRCNVTNPKTDSKGRIIDKNCLDTNPATWHLTAVNQIGVGRRSFIMDATFDYQVWNQPVYSYKYVYFNPVTLEQTDSLQDAMIPRKSYKNDKFKKYRSSKATHYVGIAMDVVYVSLVGNSTSDVDSPAHDQMTEVKYLYDLELDESGNIIGGEWYNNRHPDFIWVPAKGVFPRTAADAQIALSEWDGSTALPTKWQELARANARSGKILSSIVEVLFNRAQR
ncbi:MAG: hypothetical protein SGI74_04840 [Oligoflexia bacterium]|nr:hypothetical protein [Oligoflexia bacterium]